TPGNDVLFVCAWYGDMPASVTIAGTVATLDANYSPFLPDLPYRLLIYRARVGATPNRNVVISGSASGTYMSGACLEVTPLADSPVDQYAEDADYGISDIVEIATTSPTTQDNELVIAQWTGLDASTNVGTQSPASSGYTSLWVEMDHTDWMGGEGSFKFVTATGIQEASWTNTYTGYRLRHILTYKVAEGGEIGRAHV